MMEQRGLSVVEIGERCRALSFICTLFVILVHTVRLPKEWMASTDMCGMDLGTVLLNFGVCSNFGRLAVPMFFVLSGFWLVKSYSPTVQWWRDAVSKRVKTILLPMLIWSAVAVVYEFLRGGVKMTTYHNGFLPSEIMQFWYYRSLFIFVLFSPVVIWILRKRRMGLGLVALIWTFAFVGMPGQHQYAMWIDQAAFMIGIWLGFHRIRVKLRGDWIICATVVCMIIATVLGCLHQRMLYNRAMYLVITFGCLSLWVLSPKIVCFMKPFSTLYSLNVFIFAIHFVVLRNVGDLLNLFGLKYYSVLYMCIQYFLTVGICIGLGLMMKMIAPRVLKILSGGRG